MDQQITKKSLILLTFKTGDFECDTSTAKYFCTNLFTRRYLITFFTYGEDEVVFIGKSIIVNISNHQYEEYKKCLFKNQVLHTIILSTSGIFYQIMRILKNQNKCYLKVSKINIFKEKPFDVTHINKIKSQDTENWEIIPVTYVNCKIIHVNLKNDQYLCKMPNEYEIQ